MEIKYSKFEFIDSLRGVAILLVILVHVSQLISQPPIYLSYLGMGQLGVQLFFVLSTFTLCISAARRDESPKYFVIRRFFRIAPMYYFGIIFYYSIYSIIEFLGIHTAAFDKYTISSILLNFAFLHTFFIDSQNSVVPGGWSIGVEMIFYLLFPLLYRLLSSNKSLTYTIVFSITFIINIYIYMYLSNNIYLIGNNSFFYFGIWNQLPVFIVGFIVYNIWANRIQINSWVLFSVFFTFFVFCILIFTFYNKFLFSMLPLVSAIMFGSILLMTSKIRTFPFILSEIGRRSYSMYLVHFLLTLFVMPILFRFVEFSWMFLLPVYIVVIYTTYIISGFTVTYIEKPFVKIGNNYISKTANRLMLKHR